MTVRSHFSSAVLKTLPLLALPLISLPAHAQTTITQNGTSAVVPGGPKHWKVDTVVVAAAIDDSANPDNAKKALLAANRALTLSPGLTPAPASAYSPVGVSDAAQGLGATDWGWPFTASDYQKIGKSTHATEALTVEVTQQGTSFSAIAELYDTSNGALINRGTGVSRDGAPEPIASAVGHAVEGLTQTAQFDGVVISIPGAYQARISLGEMQGARAGARVEYLQDGQPIAYGTIVDLGQAESVATVAPESAFPQIYPNLAVRVVLNPTRERAMPSAQEISDKEDKKFEQSFTLAAGIATAVYFIWIHP